MSVVIECRPAFLRHYADGGLAAVDNFLLLLSTVLKWVLIHGYPRVIHGLSTEAQCTYKSYPRVIHALSTKPRAAARCPPVRPIARQRGLSLLLRGWRGHGKCCNALGQGLTGQQSSGSLHAHARVWCAIQSATVARKQSAALHACVAGTQGLQPTVLLAGRPDGRASSVRRSLDS